jgi:iron complex transport system ATP-binding protein
MLTIENLSVSFGQHHVLQKLNLENLHAGQLIGLIGRNGAGKSTLLKALAGLIPCEGKIQLAQQSISGLSTYERAKQIAYLPQTLPLASSLTAYELVLSGFRATSAHAATQDVEQRLAQVFSQLGIEALALRRLDQLSGGQRQMIGLAQVLARSPQLLLLDEPTSALDLFWQLTVLQMVKQTLTERQHLSLLAIHDINLAARFCDQLLVLNQGQVLALGKPETVLTPALLKQAYGVNARIEQCSHGYPIVITDSVDTGELGIW